MVKHSFLLFFHVWYYKWINGWVSLLLNWSVGSWWADTIKSLLKTSSALLYCDDRSKEGGMICSRDSTNVSFFEVSETVTLMSLSCVWHIREKSEFKANARCLVFAFWLICIETAEETAGKLKFTLRWTLTDNLSFTLGKHSLFVIYKRYFWKDNAEVLCPHIVVVNCVHHWVYWDRQQKC